MKTVPQHQRDSPLDRALLVLDGKWKGAIFCALYKAGDPPGFAEIKRGIPGIAARVLTRELRELEEWGVIVRKELPERRVQYLLTPRGQSLRPILEAMSTWGKDLTPPPAGSL